MIPFFTRNSGKQTRSSNHRSDLMLRVGAIALVLAMLVSSTALGSHLNSPTVSSPPIQEENLKIGPSLPSHTIEPSESSQTTKKSEPSVEGETPLKAIRSYHVETTVPNITSHPSKQPIPHTNLGWKFLLNGQPRAAMAAYRQALRNNPDSATAYLGLGITLKSLGNVGTAKKALVRAVNLDPKSPSALVHLGYLYAEGHFGKRDSGTARRLFHQASQLGDPFAGIALLDLKSRSSL